MLTWSKLALKILGSGILGEVIPLTKLLNHGWLVLHLLLLKMMHNSHRIIAFDNKQVLQRRWEVKLRNEVHCYNVTIIVVFNQNYNTAIQKDSTLKPPIWMSRELIEDEVHYIRYPDKDQVIKQIHYHQYMHSQVQEANDSVASEQKVRMGSSETWLMMKCSIKLRLSCSRNVIIVNVAKIDR